MENHAIRDHALLSASGAVRWINCTPSARLEEKFQTASSSVYAKEGELAHEFGELKLQLFIKAISKRAYNKEVKKIKASELYSEEMDEEVDKYVDYVIEEFEAAKKRTEGPELLIEERLDFSEWVEKGFGTGDAEIIADQALEVIDLKYGKGVRVDATDNPQLRLYGLGALRNTEMLYDIKEVKMTIVQPRLNHVSSEVLTVQELKDWAEGIVKPAAEKAFAGDGEKKAGHWCKWCKVKAMCRTLAEHNTKLASYEFKKPDLLEDDEILAIYNQLPMLVDWAAAVNDHILKTALEGKKWGGLKLVAGKSSRKWTDESAVAKALLANNYSADKFMVTKLAGITAIEKLLKKEFNDIVGDYVVKPPGKPTVVDINDKRPPLNGTEAAKEDFKE